jgi:hypothetical protein
VFPEKLLGLEQYASNDVLFKDILDCFDQDTVKIARGKLGSLPSLQLITKTQNAEKTLIKKVMNYYKKNCPDIVKDFPAMLTTGDRAAYFYAAATSQLEGEIIDAGVFLGGTTIALAEGLMRNPFYQKNREKKIQVFDLFKPDNNYIDDWLRKIFPDEFNSNLTSFRSFFDRKMEKYSNALDVFEGDIVKIGYPQRKPIAVLGLDCCKNLAITDSILRNFFPYLIPNRSIIIHQNYIHAWHPYIHISMELLKDYFEPILEIYGGCSYVWRCKKIINKDIIADIFGDISVVSIEKPSWYTNYELNNILLRNRQVSMNYARNRAELGLVRAIYNYHSGKYEESKNIVLEIKTIFPKFFIDPNLFTILDINR